MVNNSWTLIGTIVSDFEKIENANVHVYKFNMEVENGKTGPINFIVHIFADNKIVDFNCSYKGAVVAVSGELKSKSNGKYVNISLTARNLVVLVKPYNGTATGVVTKQKASFTKEDAVKHAYDDLLIPKGDKAEEDPAEVVSDEDLPF